MILYINKTFTKKIIETEMKQPGTVFFVAQDGRKAVGYAKMKMSKTPANLVDPAALEIERLYVLKEYVGKRVGYILMQTCLAMAKKNGCQTLWLGVWENNARAISFYEKNGFVKFSHHTFMLGNDAQTDWLMKKELT
jgi:ribosomal protein S18 acetylase RimI-like enzyme